LATPQVGPGLGKFLARHDSLSRPQLDPGKPHPSKPRSLQKFEKVE
jgi:hypothetical protein